MTNIDDMGGHDRHNSSVFRHGGRKLHESGVEDDDGYGPEGNHSRRIDREDADCSEEKDKRYDDEDEEDLQGENQDYVDDRHLSTYNSVLLEHTPTNLGRGMQPISRLDLVRSNKGSVCYQAEEDMYDDD